MLPTKEEREKLRLRQIEEDKRVAEFYISEQQKKIKEEEEEDRKKSSELIERITNSVSSYASSGLTETTYWVEQLNIYKSEWVIPRYVEWALESLKKENPDYKFETLIYKHEYQDCGTHSDGYPDYNSKYWVTQYWGSIKITWTN